MSDYNFMADKYINKNVLFIADNQTASQMINNINLTMHNLSKRINIDS